MEEGRSASDPEHEVVVEVWHLVVFGGVDRCANDGLLVPETAAERGFGLSLSKEKGKMEWCVASGGLRPGDLEHEEVGVHWVIRSTRWREGRW